MNEVSIARESIVGRACAASTKLVVLAAPAGYGKSTTARQIVAKCAAPFVCDPSGARTLAALAERICAGLSPLHTFAETPLSGHEAVRDTLDRVAESWRRTQARTILIENADHLGKVPGGLALLDRLLSEPNSVERILICTRVPLPLNAGKFALPHEVLRLGVDELRFSRSEIDQLFPTQASQTIDAVESTTQGWPLPLMLLHRAAAEGRLEEALLDMSSARDQELAGYISGEFVGSMKQSQRDVLLLVARLQRPLIDDVAAFFSVPPAAAREIVASVPVMSILETRIQAHPLFTRVGQLSAGDSTDDLVAHAAIGHQCNGAAVRAAQLWLEIGDHGAAARALAADVSKASWRVPEGLDETLAAIDRPTVLAHPELWAASFTLRPHAVPDREWLREGLSIWYGSAIRDVSSDVRARIFGKIAESYLHTGLVDSGAAFVAEHGPDIASDAATSAMRARWRLIYRVMLGEAVDLERESAPFRASNEDAPAAAIFESDIVARYYRMRGDTDAERAACARALDAARQGEVQSAVIRAAVDATFGAWLRGKEDEFAGYAQVLEAGVRPANEPGVRHFLECLHGRGLSARTGAEPPHLRASGRLVAAAGATNPADSRALILTAIDAADESRQPFLRILTRVAFALASPVNRDRALAEAAEIACATHVLPLREAVQRVMHRTPPYGVFDALAERFGSGRRMRAIEIRVIADNVLVDGRYIPLTDRDREVVMALAVAGRPVHRAELVAQIWPDSHSGVAARRLKTHISRIRTALGNAAAIVTTESGYGLDARVKVDLHEIETLIANEALDVAAHGTLIRTTFAALLGRSRERGRRWAWFKSCEARLTLITHRLLSLVGPDMLASTPEELIHLARAALSYDPADDAAHFLLVQALLAVGDAPSADLEVARHETAALRPYVDLTAPLENGAGSSFG